MNKLHGIPEGQYELCRQSLLAKRPDMRKAVEVQEKLLERRGRTDEASMIAAICMLFRAAGMGN